MLVRSTTKKKNFPYELNKMFIMLFLGNFFLLLDKNCSKNKKEKCQKELTWKIKKKMPTKCQ